MRIEGRGLVKRRGAFSWGPLDLHVDSGEYVVIQGENGSGKTTLLHLLAGFLRPDAGTVLFDGVDVTTSAPERRRIGFVFAQPALFPTMSVDANLSFSNRAVSGVADLRTHVIEALEVGTLLERKPHELSLGQARRVEIARALLSGPRTLLFDEPFAAIPSARRVELARRVRDIARKLSATVVHVTHDAEDVAIADRVLRMEDGQLGEEKSE